MIEAARLRVTGLVFERRAIMVRDGEGGKDRVVTLPDALIIPLRRHVANRKPAHEQDLADGFGSVYLPHALERKYPSAPKEWGWGDRSLRP